ncbi:MAG: hypothetical protein NTW95_14520 [Candidatus Aminicenantes bacterium]|nr:hypothetical protein [Candidatus Aminicenantes bacterium]
MANRVVQALLLLMLWPAPARGELLKLSLLKQIAPPFSLRRDIFLGATALADSRPGQPPAQNAAQTEAARRTIAEEIYQSVSYEGFVSKNGRSSALLNISGEFFMVNEGDVVLQKITILKIGRETVTIEYDNLPYDIKLKGDGND